ncbi:hypothetical protein PCASD_15992 [Puccinia coronata f. sp. avenae]|uniref:Uncharacterized protein n=1 Tax=Puccinia coronata f. sp. avenae TaxID=200324 RepID=A0A2N5TUF5_9BASI|nr:hypothetical protein PCASD_15992 [Puccinia coronata f. sp. avenae]
MNCTCWCYTTTPTRIIQREIGATKWPIAKLQTQRFPRTVSREECSTIKPTALYSWL